jgi:plastocyanin
MDNETLFYICGIGLAVSAVLFSLIALKLRSFPGKAFPLVVLWFAILVGGSATFAVLHARDEQEAKASELEQAGKQIEKDQTSVPSESEAAKGGKEKPQGKKPSASGPGGTLQLAADASAIAYDKASLSSKPGKVTIDFTNPGALEHDVAIEDEAGKEIANSELIGEGKTSVSAELAPGTYTFFCTVPGHREAGMEGTLTVR